MRNSLNFILKKTSPKFLAIIISLAMILCVNPIQIQAQEEIQSLTYEEYLAQTQEKEEHTEVMAVSTSSTESEMRSLDTLMDGKPVISHDGMETWDIATTIQTDSEIDSSLSNNNGLSLFTAPVAQLTPVIMNPDSLKNGLITTDTQIAWLWGFTDEDGDTLLNRYLGGFPSSYILGTLNGNTGFVTQFSNPGTYTVLYQVMDSAGELSRVVGFEVPVSPVEDYQFIADELTSSDDTKTYEMEVNFSEMSVAAFSMVRTGKTETLMTISDSDGNILTSMSTSSGIGRRWYFLEKPSSTSTVCIYTITISAKSYVPNSSGYRIMVGSKEDIEPMISGVENAVLLEKYTEMKGNQYFTSYTPNRDESWYRFTADSTMVFTLLTYYPEIRFQIRDIEDLEILFDSNAGNNADIHRTEYCTSFGYAEKARLSMSSGTEYYLVIYSPSRLSSLDIIERTMNVTVGMPNMLSNSTTAYANSSITALSSGYSTPAIINIGDNGNTIPLTAVADSVSYVSRTSVGVSKIAYWRTRVPGSTAWYSSKNFGTTVNIGYVQDSITNKNINGSWQISFQASSSGNQTTFTPGLYINYYYEIGD